MKFNRSNLYYKPNGESGLNLRIMEIIDEYYLDHPTTGVKTMTMVLREKDYTVNEKRVRRLMRKMKGQRRNSVAGLSKIDRQTVGFLIRIS